MHTMDETRSCRHLHIANAVLLVTITALIASAWSRLPDRVPVHFGFDGTPNRWSGRSELLVIVFAPWILTAMMYGFSLLLPWFSRHPEWINIPNKAAFLAMPIERRRPFFDALKTFFLALAAAINLTFLSATYGTIQVALGRAESLPVWAIWPALAMTFVVVVVHTLRLFAMAKAFGPEPPMRVG